jgi:hypothetical protein
LGTFLATAIIDGVKTKIFTQYPSGFVYMERDDNGLPFRVLHNRLLHSNKSPSQIQTNYNFVREEKEIHPTVLSVPSFCSKNSNRSFGRVMLHLVLPFVKNVGMSILTVQSSHSKSSLVRSKR